MGWWLAGAAALDTLQHTHRVGELHSTVLDSYSLLSVRMPFLMDTIVCSVTLSSATTRVHAAAGTCTY